MDTDWSTETHGCERIGKSRCETDGVELVSSSRTRLLSTCHHALAMKSDLLLYSDNTSVIKTGLTAVLHRETVKLRDDAACAEDRKSV